MLASAIQQCESAIMIHTWPPSLLPILALQVIRECKIGLPALHSTFSPALHLTPESGHVPMQLSPFAAPSPAPLCPQGHSPHLCLHSFPADRFISTSFLDSIYSISSSATPFSPCPQSFPASGSFPMSWPFASGGQSTAASASASVLPVNIQGWFPLGLTNLISWLSKELLRVFSSTTIWKHQFVDAQPSFQSNSHIHTWLMDTP